MGLATGHGSATPELGAEVGGCVFLDLDLDVVVDLLEVEFLAGHHDLGEFVGETYHLLGLFEHETVLF